MSYTLQNTCQKENERISIMPFLLWHFSPGDKIENCPAQFLAVCWIVHVELKAYRLCDGFSVSNALLLSQAEHLRRKAKLDTKGGKRREMNARLSFDTACELGFRGSLDEWERLMGAVVRR